MRKVLFLMSLLPMAVMAQTVKVGDAKMKAQHFVQSKTKTRTSQKDVQLSLAYTSKAGDETYYHVFNKVGGGYVIIGGDEAAQEVLGYSETGTFDYNSIPANMRCWLSQYDAQISQAIKEVKAGTNKVSHKASEERPEIPVMITTKWGQEEPYNAQIPTYQSGIAQAPTGCNTTALSQVMHYYKWPDSGVGTMTVDQAFHGQNFTVDFSSATYDWDAMQDVYDKVYNGTPEEIAVGTLMYHVGVAINSEYGDNVTGSSIVKDAMGLAEHLKYNKDASVDYRLTFTDEDWETLVYNELSAGRPLLYTAYDQNDKGHAFVCDGYKDGRYHINWGWDGDYNDYFLLTATDTEKALCPKGSGTGGGGIGASYSYSQRILSGLCKDPEGTTQYKKKLIYNPPCSPSESFFSGDSVKFDIVFINGGTKSDTFEITYKMVNIDDAEDTYLLDDIYTLTQNDESGDTLRCSICIPEGVKMDATYEVLPMLKDEKGEWQQALKIIGPPDFRIKIQDELELIDRISVQNNGTVCKEIFNLSFKLKNYSDKTLTKTMDISVTVAMEDDAEPIDYIDFGEITLAPGEEKEFHAGYDDLRFKDRFELDESYFLQLENVTDNKPIGNASLISYHASKPISFTIPERGWTTLHIPYNIELPEGMTIYYLNYFPRVDSISYTKKDQFEGDKNYLIHGTPGTYHFIGPDIEFNIGDFDHFWAYTSEAPLESEINFIFDIRDGVLGFYQIHEPTEIGQYESYLKVKNPKKDKYIINIDDDDPTSIEHIITRPTDSQTYDLTGRRVNANYKGLVIRDGKIYIKK